MPGLDGAGVSVIVLSYNNTADTCACLDSLYADSEGGFDVLVVDNASTDGAPAALRGRYPAIELLELAENRGWAGGNNAGAAVALGRGARLLCLLNNDTIVPPGTIAALAETADRFAPALVHPAIDYAEAGLGAQLDPSATGEPLPGTSRIFPLEYAYGACLMIPAALWRELGGLDERFFLQLEETDFWLRAKRRGARSLCDARVRIVHAESKGFGGRTTPAKSYYMARNTLLLAEKNSVGLADWARTCRSVYWLAGKMAAAAGEGGSFYAVLRWVLSGDPHGRAIRAGVVDYAWRRFGKLRRKNVLF